MPFRYRAWPTGSARRAGVRIDGGRRGRRGDGAELISASRVDVVLARGRRRRRRRRRAGGGGGRGGAWCRRGRGVSGLVSPTARGDCAQRDDDERAGDHTRVASRRRWRHVSILSVADDRQERRQVAPGRGAAPSRFKQYAPFEGERATPDPGPCSRPAHTRRNLTAPSELRVVSWRRADKLLLPGGDRRRRCRHRVSSRSMI